MSDPRDDAPLGPPADAAGEGLDALIAWCSDAVREGMGGASARIVERPPLPQRLRIPLARHGLDAFDETAIALIVGPDLDPVVALGMSELTGARTSRFATVAVIADLLGMREADRVAVASRLSASAPLARLGLLEVSPPPDAPAMGRAGPSMLDVVSASTALLRWIFGIPQLDRTLAPLVRDDLTAPAVGPQGAAAEAVAVLESRLVHGGPTLTTLRGTSSSDLMATALHCAMRAGRPALRVEADGLVEPRFSARIAAEALLREAVVIVVGDTSRVPPDRWETFESIVVIGEEPVVGVACGHDMLSLKVPRADGTAVGTHLVDLLRALGLHVAPHEADLLGRWEHLRHEDLDHLAAVIAARSPRKGPRTVTARDVVDAVAGGAYGDLARLATPLETSREWGAFVGPEYLTRDLAEFVHQAQTRVAVLRDAGFSSPGQPLGVSAVFAGPSGTGKTMAARLVAGELGLPLYSVNLAAVVSKYIGETERNLDAVFSAAERSDAVLLFDEAEALFGRRSEVQDARDRYANIEVAFLLQRVERYDGVAILATNLLDHFDEAFARRLSFCIRFPQPNEEQRLRLWTTVWPAGTQFGDDVDLLDIARRHPLAGGHIRNIAIAAVHLAMARTGVIDAACLGRAIDREYAKLGQEAGLFEEALA